MPCRTVSPKHAHLSQCRPAVWSRQRRQLPVRRSHSSVCPLHWQGRQLGKPQCPGWQRSHCRPITPGWQRHCPLPASHSCDTEPSGEQAQAVEWHSSRQGDLKPENNHPSGMDRQTDTQTGGSHPGMPDTPADPVTHGCTPGVQSRSCRVRSGHSVGRGRGACTHTALTAPGTRCCGSLVGHTGRLWGSRVVAGDGNAMPHTATNPWPLPHQLLSGLAVPSMALS